MNDVIKTAYERALERAQRIEVSSDKVKELEYSPLGARLAAQFLKEEKFDLAQALQDTSAEARPYVMAGVQSTFLSNIGLPRNPRNKHDTKRALEGLKALKKDKSKLSQVGGKIESLLAYYETTRQQAYDSLRKEFEAALSQAMQKQQLGLRPGARVDVEMQAEFQARWNQVASGLEMDYESRLSGLKKEIERLA